MDIRQLKYGVIGLALLSALGGGFALGQLGSVGSAHAAPAVQSAPATPAAMPDMAGIVARYGAAVVNISITGNQQTRGSVPELDPDDPFYEFFRRFGMPRGKGGSQPIRGQGSGFIISADGTILTNAHVVEDASEVMVKLTDRREFKAKVLGLDKNTDVAVLKIEARNLPTVVIGNSANSRVGEWVLAIGSPFGFENSASAGIISAKSRTLPDGSYVPFLQTDVAVNPGNSGGPLFNMAGEVIGINSQIYSRSGGYQGLSFAIPIDLAMNVEQQLVKHGKVQRGKLGVTIQEVNQALADSFGLAKPTGALINAVEPGSPADKAGLKPGDVILAVNDREVGNSGELPAQIATMASGESARLKIWRKGNPQEVTVKIGTFGNESRQSKVETPVSKGRLGVSVRPASPQEQRQLGAGGGLIVEEVDGAAARAGLRVGDVIISINGEPVSTPEQLRAIISKAGKKAALLIQRGDTRIFVPVDLG